jgi:protein-disulfide isomerase
MSSAAERVVSWVLTAAAVMLAAAAVYKQWAPSQRITGAAELASITFDSAWTAATPYAVHVAGIPEATVTMMVFQDLECPACRQFHAGPFTRVMERHSNAIRAQYVHFPLRQHRFARIAAQAAECGGLQGRFNEFVEAAYLQQDSLGLRPWVRYGIDARVPDTTAFLACVAGPNQFARIDSGAAVAERLRLQGTPTIIINGWRFRGVPGEEQLEAVIAALRAGRKPTAGP